MNDNYPKVERKDEIVKFRECDSDNKYRIADRWIKMLTQDPEISGKIRVRVTAVEKSKIDEENFGSEGDTDSRVYA